MYYELIEYAIIIIVIIITIAVISMSILKESFQLLVWRHGQTGKCVICVMKYLLWSGINVKYFASLP